MPILELKNLSISFKTEMGYLRVVDDVSFSVEKGEIVGLVGESGCGKSVTSFSIIRLLSQINSRVDSGEILFEGNDLLKLPSREMTSIRGKRISMIFQEPMTSLNPVYTVSDQIGEVFRNHTTLSKSEIEHRSIDLLERVGIPRAAEFMRVYPHQLSGGMRQRVMIAMAIALRPNILIADEPTTALDVTIQAQILELIKKLAIEDGMAVILISHNLGIIAKYCGRVMVMYASQLVESAEVNTLFRSPLHPYTIGLLECIPQIGMKGRRLKHINGSVPHPGDPISGCRFAARCPKALPKCSERPQAFVEVESGHFCMCEVNNAASNKES